MQRVAQRALNKQTLEGVPLHAVALRDLCRAAFATDGRIHGISPEGFSRSEGTLLFRGVKFFRYVRYNLNGEWVGTGFMSDGNYYAGIAARADAIDDYGFSNRFGWAMAYKLSPWANLAEPAYVEQISLDQFVTAVEQRYNIVADTLTTLYENGNDNGLRAVLLGYDGMVDRQQDHYVIYNPRALVYRTDCTPWAHEIETVPEELEPIERSRETAEPQRSHRLYNLLSQAQLMHEFSRFQNHITDIQSGIGLKYITAARDVRHALLEMKA